MDEKGLEQCVGDRLSRRIASIEPIAAGLGNRTFHRILFETGEPATMIARCEPEPTTASARRPPSAKPDPAAPLDSPPSHPPLQAAPAWLPEPPLEPIRGFLERAGLRVPKSYGHFPELRLDLLEDVGTTNLLRAEPAQRAALYRAACAIVPKMQALAAAPDAIPAFGRRYDADLLDTKLWKWLHWTIPGLLDREATGREIDDHEALFAAIRALLESAPRRLAHRDYKAENLHLLPSATGALPELVMIDVQGAFVAPPEYDLVCLLYDLQTDVDESLAMRLFAEVVPALPDHPSSQTARQRFDAIAVARLCKDVAHVVHAGLARGDRRRWHEIPRGLALLARSAARLDGVFPGISTLQTVILALTDRLRADDIAGEGSDR